MRIRTTLISTACACLVLVACGGGGSGSGASSAESPINPANVGVGDEFVTFESALVRPLAMSADGNRLLATNTPNSTLDIFSLTENGPTLEFSVPVGMEPVAVAVRGSEAWVVNHLSDSISIVDLAADTPHVIKTLLVGDEPRDIVFAGREQARAFITTAHRGQNGPDDQPIDAQLTTAGIPRADVWGSVERGVLVRGHASRPDGESRPFQCLCRCHEFWKPNDCFGRRQDRKAWACHLQRRADSTGYGLDRAI